MRANVEISEVTSVQILFLDDGVVIRQCEWPTAIPLPANGSAIYLADEHGDERLWIISRIAPVVRKSSARSHETNFGVLEFHASCRRSATKKRSQ